MCEYWLLDPDAEEATFYRLGPDGRYEAVDLDADGVYHSGAVLGFWLRPAWLWPQAGKRLDALAALGGLGVI